MIGIESRLFWGNFSLPILSSLYTLPLSQWNARDTERYLHDLPFYLFTDLKNSQHTQQDKMTKTCLGHWKYFVIGECTLYHELFHLPEIPPSTWPDFTHNWCPVPNMNGPWNQHVQNVLEDFFAKKFCYSQTIFTCLDFQKM